MLALIGEETHLLGLLLEHATEECTFLVERLALTVVVGTGARMRVALLLEHLAQELELAMMRTIACRVAAVRGQEVATGVYRSTRQA